MTKSSTNDARVTARIPSSVKETIEKAAHLTGATLNQFIVQAALKEAHNILKTEQVISLSERDAEKVFSLIENPPVPNEKLKAIATKHQAFFHEAD